MIRAYNQMYLDDAMKNLGEAFDYASNCCDIELDDFMDVFVTEGIAEKFGSGMPRFVSGLSGTELVHNVMEKTGYRWKISDVQVEYDCSPEYWCGWILAYYQWYTGMSFKNIKQHISMQELLDMYSTLHEASEDKFVETLNKRIDNKKLPTSLQTIRKAAGYSQANLADKSGVSLRMIQQYEQRVKDINKASAESLVALSKTLGCRVEDLLESF